MPQNVLNDNELREALKRCPESTIQAALAFRQSRDAALVAPIVLGIIERFIEPEVRPVIRDGRDSTRLVEDLGIDSLLMVEIVILTEEVLGITVDNEELRNLRTLGDVKAYLRARVLGEPSPLRKIQLNLEQIAAVMPHQAPFLFLREARINGEFAEGSYPISGTEFFLQGHFRDEPVFPASLMLEALGQLAVLFMLKSENPGLQDRGSSSKILFVSADGIRNSRIVRPPETLQLKVRLKKAHPPLVQFEGWVFSNGVKVAKAEELTLTYLNEAASATDLVGSNGS